MAAQAAARLQHFHTRCDAVRSDAVATFDESDAADFQRWVKEVKAKIAGHGGDMLQALEAHAYLPPPAPSATIDPATTVPQAAIGDLLDANNFGLVEPAEERQVAIRAFLANSRAL